MSTKASADLIKPTGCLNVIFVPIKPFVEPHGCLLIWFQHWLLCNLRCPKMSLKEYNFHRHNETIQTAAICVYS